MDIGLVTLSEYDEDGFLTIAVERLGDESSCDPGEAHHPAGYYSRPLDPVVGSDGQLDPLKSAHSGFWFEGETHLSTMPFGDPRVIPKLPRLAKGAAVHYGGQPASLSYALADDGGYAITVPSGAKATITCGSTKITVDSTSVKLGNDSATPIVLAPGLVQYLAGIEAALNALAAAVDAKLPSSPGVASGAVTTLISNIAAAKQAMQATIVKGV